MLLKLRLNCTNFVKWIVCLVRELTTNNLCPLHESADEFSRTKITRLVVPKLRYVQLT